MLSKALNERMSRVGPGTPMGEALRHYWFPVLFSHELPGPDCPPKKIRLLGEDLVAFRDSNGDVGILDDRCPHRGTSLALGRAEDGGLRCLYHGWNFAKSGELLDTPTESEPAIRRRVRVRSHGVHEWAGTIWAHIGDGKPVGPPPHYEWMDLPPERVVLTKLLQQSNWIQAVEGAIDFAHIEVLHGDYVKAYLQSNQDLGPSAGFEERTVRVPGTGKAPAMRVADRPYGFVMGGIREAVADPEQSKYVTIEMLVMPSTVMANLSDRIASALIFVPVDDYQTVTYTLAYGHAGPVDREAILNLRGHVMGVDMDEQYRPYRNEANGWLQDRKAMARNESFSGIRGLAVEDTVIQEAMGRIVAREFEHLGQGDKTIIHYRQMLLAATDSVERGERPLGADIEDYADLRGGDRVIGKDEPWEAAIPSTVAETASAG